MSVISREAALDAIDKNRQDLLSLRMDGAEHILVHYGRKVIEELPTAEEVGKWIEFDSTEDKYDVIKCPFCKHIFTVDSYHWSDIGFVKDDFKFCPNCGARMEGRAEDER